MELAGVMKLSSTRRSKIVSRAVADSSPVVFIQERYSAGRGVLRKGAHGEMGREKMKEEDFFSPSPFPSFPAPPPHSRVLYEDDRGRVRGWR